MTSSSDTGNPFSPGFGLRPLVLAGRGEVVDNIKRAVSTGPRDPWFTAVLTGDRGVGKTAVLDEVEVWARSQGWAVVHEQVVENEPLLAVILKDLVSQAGTQGAKVRRALREVDIEASLGINAGVVSAGVKARPTHAAGMPTEVTRDVLRIVGEHAKSKGVGVLLTIDEVQNWTSPGELRAFAAALQLVTRRESLPVAVCFAGLPSAVQVAKEAGTFFERASYSSLGSLSQESVEYAFLKTAELRGVLIESRALDTLVDGAVGYPYLIQLIGYHAWPDPGSKLEITEELAKVGVQRGREEMERLFVGRWDQCSPLEQAYLWAAALNEGVVKLISGAMGRSTEELSPVRHALIRKHHLLDPAGYGKVSFALPGFAAWIQANGPIEIPKPRRRAR